MNARTEIPLGLFHDMPIEQYHAAPGLSNSGLSDFARSPLHYYALHLDPRRPPRVETAAQLVGNMAHCAILEPARFRDRYPIGPAVHRNSKEWRAFAEEHPGKSCIKPDEAAEPFAQAAAARLLPDVGKILATGEPEVSAFWIDQATGELCRCRPDWVHPVGERGVILADVKTIGNASPREFARQVGRMGYHRQAAFYSDGFQIASGLQVLGFVFIAVESAWPYASAAVMLDDESLEKGRTEIAEMMPRFAECSRTGTWPGYSEAIELIGLPAWALAA